MATTVTYKGQTLTTVENETKVLETKGTWVEDDFTLTDVTQGGGGGGGIQLLNVVTVAENVRAVNLDLTPYHSYDEIFIFSDVTLSSSDWLYIVVNGSEPSGGNYTQVSLVNHRGLFAYMGKLSGRPTETERYTGIAATGVMVWKLGYVNNLYIYTYVASKSILAGSKFYIYGGNYADILQ